MIVGIHGKKGSGKDTIARMFGTQWQNRKFADKLKSMICVFLGCDISILESQEFKETPIEWLNGITPRYLMQTLGTDWGRNLHENIWVESLMSEYKTGRSPSWLVTDVRFPNEVQSIKDRGGLVIRVIRPGMESNDTHPSETSLDNYTDWDHTIINDGSIKDLGDAVIDMVSKLKLTL